MSPESTQKRESPFIWLFLLAAINIGGPFLPIPNVPTAVFGGLVLTPVYVAAVVLLGLSIARLRLSHFTASAYLAICALLWASVEYGIWPYVRRGLRAIREWGGEATTSQQLLFFGTTTLQDLAMVCGACFAGTILAKLIRHANMIGPIGAAIALIDIWGVLFGGIVSQMLENKATQPLAEKAMAAGPKIGAAGAGVGKPGFSLEIPSIGVGDFLFIALLLSVLVNLSMNWKTSARLMWMFVTAALLAITFLPWFPHLPGLLFIAAGAVLPNWGFFKFTREESFALLYAGIFVVILTIGLFFGFQFVLPN